MELRMDIGPSKPETSQYPLPSLRHQRLDEELCYRSCLTQSWETNEGAPMTALPKYSFMC